MFLCARLKSWYKEVDPNNPSALIPLTEKTFKYKFEATIPEPDVCTDCILARITVINVIAGDYGTYVLRATSEQSDFKDLMSESKVRLYRKLIISSFSMFNDESIIINSNCVIVSFSLTEYANRDSGVPTVDYEPGQPRMSQSAAEALILMIIVVLDYSSIRLYFQFFYSFPIYKNYSRLLIQIIEPQPNRLAFDSERFLNLHL